MDLQMHRRNDKPGLKSLTSSHDLYEDVSDERCDISKIWFDNDKDIDSQYVWRWLKVTRPSMVTGSTVWYSHVQGLPI